MTSLDGLSPSAEQMAMLAAYPDDKPFVMVNLLKYKGAAGAERYLMEYEPAFFAMASHPGFAATQEIRVASLDAITLLLSSEYR